MSGATGRSTGAGSGRVVEASRRVDDLRGSRGAALLGSATLVFAFGFALFSIVDIVGDPTTFFLLVAGSLVAATLLSQVVRARTAVVVGAFLLAGGLGFYLLSLPADVLSAQDRIISDIFAMLTGLSVLRLQKIGLWTLGFTPAPVFLTWYFAMRRHYVAAAATGGAALTLFVLTGDLGETVALLGVVGALATVGFGRLERYGGSEHTAEALAVVLAVMIVLTATVSVIPGGSGQPVSLFGDSQGQADTVEASLINADQRLRVQGSIELSPEVRFSVESNQRDYWRVAAYDRYTGDGWVRTGSAGEYGGRLVGPPGRATTVEQRYEIESTVSVMPAAWRPVAVEGDEADEAMVTDMAGFQPADPLDEGDSYQVTSRRPSPTRGELARAGEDYPRALEQRFTQLPASTPSRVARRTSVITERASNPYETAVVVEQWLENNRQYSLDVDRPEGNIADAFLFEMNSGYCTYYATTMVTMLRSQGIPARLAVGYTPGEQVARNRWVARGYNSHAWVEVYFPDIGWVRFDPTPADPRTAAEQARLDQARANNESSVDTDDTAGNGSAWTPTPTETPDPITPTPGDDPNDPNNPDSPTTSDRTPTPNGSETDTTDTLTVTDEDRNDDDGGLLPDEPPSREELALGLIVVAGMVAGVRRSGVTERAYRTVWVRWQPRETPAADVERAYRRLEYLLGKRHRPRRAGETPRQYLDAVDADERATRVLSLYERSHYAGIVSEDAADEAVRLVNELTRRG